MNPNDNIPISPPKTSMPLVRPLVRYILKRWVWIFLAGCLGAVLGFGLSRITKHQYHAEASFIVSRDMVDQQELRFGSRDLVLEAVYRLEFGGVSFAVEKGWRGKVDVYRHSPITIELRHFPEHFLDYEMEIEILSEEEFRFQFKDLEGNMVGKSGYFFHPFRMGAIEFTLLPTLHFNQDWLHRTVYFEVESDERLISKYRGGLYIERLLKHPNKITVRFTDENHLRAKEFMEALTQVYLSDWELQHQPKAELEILDKQIDDLLGEIQGLQGYDDLTALIGETEGEDIGKALISKLDSMHLVRRVLDRRIELLGKGRELGFPLYKDFRPFVNGRNDSSLIQLHQGLGNGVSTEGISDFTSNKSNFREYNALRLKIMEKDLTSRNELLAEMRETQALLSIKLLLRKKFLQFSLQELPPQMTYRWEQLLQLFEKRVETMKTMASSQPKVRLLESPHLLPLNNRSRILRMVVTGGGVGTVLAFSLLLVLGMAADPSVLQNLLSNELGIPLLGVIRQGNTKGGTSVREMHATLELQRGDKERIWAFGGRDTSPEQSEVLSGLANRQTAAGNFVLCITFEETEGDLTIPVIPEPKQGAPSSLHITGGGDALGLWMLSPNARQMMKAAAGSYDLLFIQVPPLDEVSEGIALIHQSDIFIHFIGKKGIDRSAIEGIHQRISHENLRKLFVLVDR